MGRNHEYDTLQNVGRLSGIDMRIRISAWGDERLDDRLELETVEGTVVGDHPALGMRDGDVVTVAMPVPRDTDKLIRELKKGSADYGEGAFGAHLGSDEVVFANCEATRRDGKLVVTATDYAPTREPAVQPGM